MPSHTHTSPCLPVYARTMSCRAPAFSVTTSTSSHAYTRPPLADLQLPKRIGGCGTSPPGMPGGRKPALVWFRNDLRLHDHEPLAAACQGATSVLPVYVFDPREYGKVGARGCV